MTGMLSSALSDTMTLLQHGSEQTAASSERPCPPGNTFPAQRELHRLRVPKTPGEHPDLRLWQHRQELVKGMRLWLCTSDPEER